MGSKVDSKYEAVLASKCQSIARCLTYNDGEHEAAAKHALLEASHMLDWHSVRIYKEKGQLRLVNARGKSRLATLRERLAIWLLGGKTEIRP